MDKTNNPFYGVATIGSKGQLVIPIKAREDLGLKPGDQVIIAGRIGQDRRGMLCAFPMASAERFVQELTEKLTDVRSAIENAKGKEEK